MEIERRTITERTEIYRDSDVSGNEISINVDELSGIVSKAKDEIQYAKEYWGETHTGNFHIEISFSEEYCGERQCDPGHILFELVYLRDETDVELARRINKIMEENEMEKEKVLAEFKKKEDDAIALLKSLGYKVEKDVLEEIDRRRKRSVPMSLAKVPLGPSGSHDDFYDMKNDELR